MATQRWAQQVDQAREALQQAVKENGRQKRLSDRRPKKREGPPRAALSSCMILTYVIS